MGNYFIILTHRYCAYRNFCYYFLLIFATAQFSKAQFYTDSESCGTLYSEENATGIPFLLHDQDQSSNLVEDERAAEGGWNVTGSIVIENGCKMEVCNETYFNGDCQTLNHGSYSTFENNFMKEISSVECRCAKECKCSDIHIKISSCGRAYLEGGCRTCHALYTDLSLSEKHSQIFPDEFVDRVEAIRLRKGCTLTIFSEEDFEGDERIIDRDIVEDFNGIIGSYKCDCDDSLYEPKPRPVRPKSYPPLIDIPESMDDVIKMLGTEEYRQHPGLLAARRSFRNGRSSKNAYILLIGSTGAGKSSSINLLFDNPNVTKTGDFNSTTSDIHEFRIPVPIDELGIANSELRVIDTPGLGDTRGLEQDAKFLATLDNYLSTHEELRDRIPNVVLIFHKFHDNRAGGEGSQFVKMIRGLDVFTKRFADEEYSNIIFVFSHFCSVTKKERRKPEARVKKFKEVIEDYSLYPKPIHISIAENKAMEQEVPMVNGYYKLPNNEYYPRNLFEKLELVTQKGGDTIGLGVFRTAFRDSEAFNVSASTFDLVSSRTGSVEKYLNILTNANIGVVKTEVSQHLEDVWNLQVDAELRKRFPFSLAYLQKALNLRNINIMSDVPRTTPDILNLMTALKNDDATTELLEKGLGIKSPEFPLNSVAGHSYNVFKDIPLTTSPFRLGDLQQSDIGFMIPKSLTCKLEPGTKEHLIVFDNKEKYVQHRLRNLGIEGTIPLETFTGAIMPGLNIKELSFRNDSCSLTAAKDFRTFEFVLNDKMDLTQEFQNAVKALSPLNDSDFENVDQWKRFFNTYGTHVVQSVYGGGSIQIKLESDKPYNEEFSQAIFDLVKFAEDLTYDMSTESADNSTNRTVLMGSISQSMTFLGGNPDFHTNDLSKMPATEANKLMLNWKKSLKFYPAVLTTEMRLKPISQIVKKMRQNYTEEIERTTKLLFKSELSYTEPIKKKNQGPGYSRDDTPAVQEMMLMIQQSNDRMNELMLEMKKAEQENEANRLKLEEKRLELQYNQTIIDREFQERQLNLTREADEKRQDYRKHAEEEKLKHEVTMKKLQMDLKAQENKAAEDNHRRQQEIIRLMIEMNKAKDKGCLKAGTKILMADMTEKKVETVKTGDVIMDKDFKPTMVLGVLPEFSLSTTFYGFEEGSYFFTANHLFVGPKSSLESDKQIHGQNDFKLFAASTFELYLNNPLMAYLNVTEIGGSENITLYHKEKTLSTVKQVFPDPEIYPVDTLMYDILVDSPTGTYFANGYVCRHEIPPVENWPNTMSIMFQLMSTPTFDKLSLFPYTVENTLKLTKLTEEIAEMVEDYLSTRIQPNGSNVIGEDQRQRLMTLENINIDACISRIFSNSIVSTVAVNLYAKAGIVIARYLDNENVESHLNDAQIAVLQHELYDFMNLELEKLPLNFNLTV